MTEQIKKDIQIIFTPQTFLAFDEVVKTFNINIPQSDFLVKIIKKFAEEEIKTEKELVDNLQKELGVDAKKAGEVAKEIIEKVVPLLQKVTEEQLNNPAFMDEFERKYFGGPGKPQIASQAGGVGAGSGFSGGADIFPTTKISVEDQSASMSHQLPKIDEAPEERKIPKSIKPINFDDEENLIPSTPKRGRPKKSPADIIDNSLPPASQNNQRTGPDSYREKID